jgi:transcriptional regulator with XRE-family HTH domain
VAKRPNQIVVSKKEIGSRIKLLRQEQGLTQVELAGRLDMTQSNLSAIERGARGVTVHQVVRIAKALKASTDQILLAGAAPEPSRRASKRLMKQLQRIEELPARDQRLVVQLVEGLVMRRREKRSKQTPSSPEKPRESKIA